ncbi:unnamed protein product [Lasius platythorax]|uniref:Uncharacterized protein n=1 Tax=Lasius platythorax TaxID=488582 RepID=A0AAV2N909_9HYME
MNGLVNGDRVQIVLRWPVYCREKKGEECARGATKTEGKKREKSCIERCTRRERMKAIGGYEISNENTSFHIFFFLHSTEKCEKQAILKSICVHVRFAVSFTVACSRLYSPARRLRSISLSTA